MEVMADPERELVFLLIEALAALNGCTVSLAQTMIAAQGVIIELAQHDKARDRLLDELREGLKHSKEYTERQAEYSEAFNKVLEALRDRAK